MTLWDECGIKLVTSILCYHEAQAILLLSFAGTLVFMPLSNPIEGRVCWIGPCRLLFLTQAALLAFFIGCFFPSSGQADTKIIITKATYVMGDGETPSFAEDLVLRKAKQAALEQAGTYVESYSKVQNFDLTKDEIQTLTGGIINVEVLSKGRSVIGDGIQFSIEIRASVVTDNLEALANRIRSKTNISRHYIYLQEQYARLKQELDDLKNVSSSIRKDGYAPQAADRIEALQKDLSSLVKEEKLFQERLVSGIDLFRAASQELAERQTIKMRINRDFASLKEFIRDRGHVLVVGAPEVRSSLKQPDFVNVYIPITLNADKDIETPIRQYLNLIADPDVTPGDQNAHIRRVQEFVKGLRLGVEILVDGNQSITCYFKESVSAINITPAGRGFRVNYQERKFRAKLRLPFSSVKDIHAVRGRFLDPDYASMSECELDPQEG